MDVLNRRARRAAPWVLTAAILVLAGSVGTPIALGHARLSEAFPAPESVVDVVPQSVWIRFTEAVELAFSQIQVLDADGNRVDATDSADTRQARTGVSNVLEVPLKVIGPGTYTVSWQVVSVDSHTTRGTYTFTVAEGAAAPAAGEASEE